MAEVYGADARFAAATVLATHAACPVTIPLWLHFVLQHAFFVPFRGRRGYSPVR